MKNEAKPRVYDILARAFAQEEVHTCFALLGDANMNWAERLAQAGCRMIYVRHEHCALAAAMAYARKSRDVGVATVTCGPGVTQLITALPETSYFDSTLSFAMARTGRVSTIVLGAFQVAQNGDLANWSIPSGGGGIGGGLYHSQSIEATFAHVPGLKVVIPSNPYDAKGLLKSAVRDDNPVLFLEAKKGYRLIKGDVPEGDYTVPIGAAKVTREGDDISVYAYGIMHYYCEQAAEEVAQDGIHAELVDIRTLNPLDKETILNSFKKTGKALIVYEDNEFLGYGAEIAAILSSEGFN